MTIERQLGFWAVALLVTTLLIYVLSDVLLPFVAGLAIAYLLNPLVGRIEKLGTNRIVACVVVFALFFLVIGLALVAIVPPLTDQIVSFAARLPQLIDQFEAFGRQIYDQWLGQLLDGAGTDLQGNLSGLAQNAVAWLIGLFNSLWSGGMAVVNLLALMTVTPVVAFYLLMDWPRLIASVDDKLPREHRDTIRRLAAEMDDALAGFVRGQGLVCLLLGGFYAIGLTLLGLNFGLMIGLFAGLVSFVPYVGTILGFVLSMSVAIVQFWPDWPWIAAVAVVFAAGQFMEGNILQPKLVGSHVRLHPVWLMFALFAFGYLYGFVGMLLAVPIAALIGVLVRFGVAQYLLSPLYRGRGDGGDLPESTSETKPADPPAG
ncbi:MAG: AI-2E family transporter [Pseudomonadota bacterium]